MELRRLISRLMMACALLAVILPASLVVGDAAPGYPYTVRQYFVEGLEDYPDHTFMLVYKRTDNDTVEVHKLKSGERVPTIYRPFFYETHLYAVTGEVPDEVTREWLDEADTLSIECADSFRASLRSYNDDRHINEERVTYKLRIPAVDEEREQDEKDEEAGDEKEGNDEDDDASPRRPGFPGPPPTELRVVGQQDGPLHLIPARFVRVNHADEVMLERNFLEDDDSDDDKSSKASADAANNRAAINSGVLIFASGIGVLLLLGLVALRRMRD